MDNFLTKVDFVDNIQLSIPTNLETDFNSFLGRMQIEFLRLVLGVEFYNSFKAGIEEEVPDSVWTNLRDGIDFTYDGELEHFDGLKKGLKYYTYVKYLQNNTFAYVSGHATIPKIENSQVVSPASNSILIQNKCIDFCLFELVAFLDSNVDDYPTYNSALISSPWPNRFNPFGI